MKIHFHKSELFCFRKAKEYHTLYTQIICCQAGEFPFKYLGIPMHNRKPKNIDWHPIEERFENKLSVWKGKYFSVGGRLNLLNASMSSLPIYMLSFFF